MMKSSPTPKLLLYTLSCRLGEQSLIELYMHYIPESFPYYSQYIMLHIFAPSPIWIGKNGTPPELKKPIHNSLKDFWALIDTPPTYLFVVSLGDTLNKKKLGTKT